MATEEYAIGYEEGLQAGWNAAVESLPAQRKPLTKQRRIEIIESLENEHSWHELIDAVEAAHNIKGNT